MKEFHRGSCLQDTSNQAEVPRIKVLPYGQVLISAFIVVGAIIISAVASDYAGSINLKFGADGIQVQVDGGEKSP